MLTGGLRNTTKNLFIKVGVSAVSQTGYLPSSSEKFHRFN